MMETQKIMISLKIWKKDILNLKTMQQNRKNINQMEVSFRVCKFQIGKFNIINYNAQNDKNVVDPLSRIGK